MGWQDAPLAGQDAWANAPIVTAGPPKMPPINENREGLAPDRAMAGLKLGSEGVAQYLEGKYGVGGVSTDKDGSFYVKDGGEWIPFDSPKLNMRDVFDLSGLGVAALPVAGGEALAGKVAPGLIKGAAKAMGLGAAGSVLQQAVGAATPGGDPMSGGARVATLLMDTAAGGLGDAAARGISRVPGAVRNTYLRQTGQADLPTTRDGQAVNDYLMQGYDPATDGPMDPSLTPGQRSQRKGLLTLEGSLRRSPTGASPLFQAKDEAQLLAGKKRFDELMQQISANPRNREMLGTQVIKAFDDTLDGAMSVLDNQAAQDFKVLDTKAGKEAIFALPSTMKALDGMIAEYDVPGAAADATKGLVRQLHSLRDTLSRTTSTPASFKYGVYTPAATSTVDTKRSAAEFQRLLSSWGRAAAGKNTPFLDIPAREQTGIAKRVFGALNEDLDAAASSASAPAELRQARDNYRQNFQAVDSLRKSSIGRVLGMAEDGTLVPEKVADQLMRMEGSQIRQTFALLDKADPQLAGDAKRTMLERAMFQAQPAAEKLEERLQAGTMGVTPQGTVPETYSPARLITNLSKSPAIEVMTPTEKFGVSRLNAAMQRLANRAGTEGSPTGPLMWAADIAKNFVRAGVTGDVVAAGQLVASTFGPTQLAKAITSPDSLNALVALTQPNATREAIMAAMATLGGMSVPRGMPGENVRPFGATPTPGASMSPPLQ